MNLMKRLTRQPTLIFALGIALGGALAAFRPQQTVTAASAHGNDKFSMCTVEVARNDTEAVFVLDHLTGILRGGVLNNGRFTQTYLRNIAQDFQMNPATPEPKYAFVSGHVNLQGSGAAQPATGVLYVGELTSGAVVAYAYGRPSARGSATPMELVRLDGFSFREAVGR